MKKTDMFWQSYVNLEKALINLSSFIYITDIKIVNKDGRYIEESLSTHLEVFSPYIADLLVQVCVQIEAISKELYFDLGGTKPRGDSSIYFDEDCLKEIDKKWKTHQKAVLVVAPYFNLTKDENKILHPLRNAHIRKGAYWERAYQAVKHDRFNSLSKGNLKALIHALAALYLLNIYYRNESWITSYQDIDKLDLSLGSNVFTVKHPQKGEPWNGNIPEQSDSPYVVRYKKEKYDLLKKLMQQDDKAHMEYFNHQPELEDHIFKEMISKNDNSISRYKKLGQFRFNKRVPNNIPFEQRKEKLIATKEWNNPTINHISENELSEDNIQNEIDSIGQQTGIYLWINKRTTKWTEAAVTNNWCEVSIG